MIKEIITKKIQQSPKFLACVVLVFLLFFSPIQRVISIEPISYDTLFSIEINQILPENILNSSVLKLVNNDGDVVTYTIESTDYSHPHIIHTNTSNEVIFLQLTIPPQRTENTLQFMQSLGTPDLTTGKSKSGVLYGYPSIGLSFIVNQYSGRVERIQKYTPSNKSEYIDTYATNYLPQQIQTQDTSSFFQQLIKAMGWKILAGIILFVLGLLGILGIYKSIRKS